VRQSWMNLPDLPGRRWSIPISYLYWIVTVLRSVIPCAREHSSRVSGYLNVAGHGEMPQTPCEPGVNRLSRDDRARAAAGRMKAWTKKNQVSACNEIVTTHYVQHTYRASPLTPASVVV
jgi:hypothetical protein